MKRLNILLFIPVLLILFVSCSKEERWDCVKSTGKIVQDKRIIPGQLFLAVKDDINLVFKENLGDTFIVEAGKNLLPKIETYSDGTYIWLKNNNTCNWVRSFKKEIKVYVDNQKFQDVFFVGYGSGSNIGTLKRDKLFIHNYSNADLNLKVDVNYLWVDMDKLANVTFSGRAYEMLAINYGTGQLRMQDIKCTYLTLTNKGPGMCYAHSDSVFHGHLLGTGNIYYSGNPPIFNLDRQGKGEYIKN